MGVVWRVGSRAIFMSMIVDAYWDAWDLLWDDLDFVINGEREDG